MELENVNSKSNAGLTLGIIGTAGWLLNTVGMHNGLFGMGYGYNGGYNGCNNSFMGRSGVNHDDLAYTSIIAAKDSEIALLKSEQNTEIKIADVYERLITKINENQREQSAWNANQSVQNARISAAIATNNESIHDLESVARRLTKVVIPADNVCPEPMARYNSWTAPTAEAPTPVTGA